MQEPDRARDCLKVAAEMGERYIEIAEIAHRLNNRVSELEDKVQEQDALILELAGALFKLLESLEEQTIR